MIKLSDNDIDEIIGFARHVWAATENFRGQKRKEYFMRDFEGLLKLKSSGLRENVCSKCLGTGYSKHESIR